MARCVAWVTGLPLLIACSLSCGSADSARSDTAAGACTQPECARCQDCLATCLCTTGDATTCAQACGATSSSGAGGSTGGVGGGAAGTGTTGGTGASGGAGGTGGSAGDGGLGGSTSSGGAGGDTSGVGGTSGVAGTGGTAAAPPYTPVYRISVRVHIGQSTLPEAELRGALEEANQIWLSQAGICFEFQTVLDDVTQSTGFDLWFVPVVPSDPSVNGIYMGDHDIWSRDYPNLGSAPNPVTYPAARTSAHEIGHGLRLDHYNGYADSYDHLMSSGRLGFKVSNPNLANVYEIDVARARAQQKALADTTPLACGPPQISR